MKSLLMCEYSEEIAAIFKEGVEAVFFRSPDELVEKINYYLENETLRVEVAEHGYQAVHNRGHDLYSRFSRVVEQVKGISAQS